MIKKALVLWMTFVLATTRALVASPMAASLQKSSAVVRYGWKRPIPSPHAVKVSLYWCISSRKCCTKGDNEISVATPKIGDTMTVHQIWKSSLECLKEQGVTEPEWSVAHLLASAMELPWSNGFSRLQRAMEHGEQEFANQKLTTVQCERYQTMLERRLQEEPLQYILGKWDFLDYEQLVVRPPLLCPRPETEELVELVREDLQTIQKQLNNQHEQVHILDVGCGTGVIGISLADRIKQSSVVAIDVEPIAVATSLENAKLVLGDSSNERYTALECAAADYSTTGGDQYDVIVSNPPYIPRDDMRTLSRDVVHYESEQALCGGDDGMDVIRTIVYKWAKEWGTKPHSVCWMEVDPTHPARLQSWLEEEEQRGLGVVLESTHKDLSGRDRFVRLSFRNDGQ